jgi:GNAT superfamily N-acetyltransferase
VLSIVKWPEFAGNKGAATALDAIFFEASGTKTFASDEARAAFRERWLGRYLRLYSNWVYLVVDGNGGLQGYLLGCLDDPATTPLFSDIGYFQDFAPLTARFPAQLHVNIASAARGCGVGSQLVSAFVGDAAKAGCPGVHVVTGRDQRNVGFYERNGFLEQGHVMWNGRELVFLARAV